jgi:hypothetical protein
VVDTRYASILLRRGEKVMRHLSLVSIVALTSGCITTATVHRWGAPPIESKIVGADKTNFYVEDDEGRRYHVPRSTVKDIDHPGNVALAVGLSCLAIGSILYFSHDDEGRGPDEARRTAAFGYAVPGALLSAWGGYFWLSSRAAAGSEGANEQVPMPTLVPVVAADIVLPPGVVPAAAHPPSVVSPTPVPPSSGNGTTSSTSPGL